MFRFLSVVVLGDYIDRGPDSKGVIEILVGLQKEYPGRIHCLEGNHEQWMLGALEGTMKTSWLVGMEGLSTIESYSPEMAKEFRRVIALQGSELLFNPEKVFLPFDKFFYKIMPPSHLEFFDNLLLYYRAPGVIFAHAGVRPGVPFERQKEYDLLWITEEFHHGYDGKETVIFGHFNASKLREDGKAFPYYGHNNIIGIDTSGCGVLTAYLWPTGEVIQVGK